MPLNPAPLQDALRQLSTTGKPADANTAAQKIAQAYQQYAMGATAGGFPLATGGPGMATMQAPLAAALSILPGTAPLVAQGFATMVLSFWGGAVFTAVPFPGIAAPPVATPALIAALTPLFSVPNNPVDLYAAQVAAALDACTRSVLVTIPQVPPAPPLVVPVM